MRINVNIHTEDNNIFHDEKRGFSGQIAIPGTKATLIQCGLTSDKSYGRETDYIVNCWLNGEPTEVNEITSWLYSKVKDKAVKITIGDLLGKSDYVEVNREEILKVLRKWLSLI